MKKFGWCDLEPIKNNEAVSKYLTKYITKTILDSESGRGVKESEKNIYYCSQGLNRSQVIKKEYQRLQSLILFHGISKMIICSHFLLMILILLLNSWIL